MWEHFITLFSRYDQVFARGLSLIEVEIDHKYLDSKHKLFQARVMKKMMQKQDEETDDIAAQVLNNINTPKWFCNPAVVAWR